MSPLKSIHTQFKTCRPNLVKSTIISRPKWLKVKHFTPWTYVRVVYIKEHSTLLSPPNVLTWLNLKVSDIDQHVEKLMKKINSGSLTTKKVCMWLLTFVCYLNAECNQVQYMYSSVAAVGDPATQSWSIGHPLLYSHIICTLYYLYLITLFWCYIVLK